MVFKAGDGGGDRSRTPYARRGAVRVGLGVTLVYLAFLPPGIVNFDGNSMLAVTESLVRRGDVTVPPDVGIEGRDGQHYSRHYPLLSVLAVPPVALGFAVGALAGLPGHYVAAVFALPITGVLSGATAGLVLLLALRVGATYQGAFLAAMAYAFGTIALVYGRTFFADPLLAFLTILAVYAALGHTPKELWYASLATGLAVLAKPAGAIVGPILSLVSVKGVRPRWAPWAPAAGTAAGLSLYAAYNVRRFGSPWSFGQPYAFSLSQLPEGMVGLLLSPGRGLLWYAPVALLAAGVAVQVALRGKLVAHVTAAALFVAYLVLHAAWAQWAGGWSWGPRFLLPALPVVLAIVGREARWHRLVVGLAAIGVVVNAPTLISFYERYYAEASEGGVAPTALVWQPSHAPFLHQWSTAYRQIEDAAGHDPRELVRRAGAPEGLAEGSEMFRVVAVWWWMLPVIGVPWWAGLSASLVLMSIAAVLLARAGWCTPKRTLGREHQVVRAHRRRQR